MDNELNIVGYTVDCPRCKGRGARTCGTCDGTGEVAAGEACDTCEGAGLMYCELCRGVGSFDELDEEVQEHIERLDQDDIYRKSLHKPFRRDYFARQDLKVASGLLYQGITPDELRRIGYSDEEVKKVVDYETAQEETRMVKGTDPLEWRDATLHAFIAMGYTEDDFWDVGGWARDLDNM